MPFEPSAKSYVPHVPNSEPMPALYKYASVPEKYGRFALGAFLALSIFFIIFDIRIESGILGIGAIFIPMANLAFHELGHMVLGVVGFPYFLVVLGGTLGQLAMPASIMGKAIWNRSPIWFWLGFAWFCQNLTSVSKYMSDANVRALTLFSPSALSDTISGAINNKPTQEIGHDWNYLFDVMGLLSLAETIGFLTFWLGILGICFSVWALSTAAEARVLWFIKRKSPFRASKL